MKDTGCLGFVIFAVVILVVLIVITAFAPIPAAAWSGEEAGRAETLEAANGTRYECRKTVCKGYNAAGTKVISKTYYGCDIRVVKTKPGYLGHSLNGLTPAAWFKTADFVKQGTW